MSEIILHAQPIIVFLYFLNTIQIGSNWYMDTGVRDLEVATFKANST